ncbi:hypothetical protein CC80DRAFT_595433 [Byssothecium circinans]|uniref:Uncharacterized protein n=1 Tax=Byssothecium circinans TaxID=147558 RepID=A0A6A5TMB8_9PLEO|nr:hypothetical protein CC80DRAFT_595433 [Byssothecium circinans]
MRYIRFLKTPRIARDKHSSKETIACLITITSDLGDSFLPQDIVLSAELLHAVLSDGDEEMEKGEREEVLLHKSIKWTAGMRSLPVTLPLSKPHSSRPLRIRIGVQPKSGYDEFSELVEEQGWRGVVSAWSGVLDAKKGVKEAEKFAGRRFDVGADVPLQICEETGDSIAKHLWDAGIALACHVKSIVADGKMGELRDGGEGFRALELGTGCGVVGITLAFTIPNSNIILTDLSEAREIVQRNISLSKPSLLGTVEFQELDWKDENLPSSLSSTNTSCPLCNQIDLIVAADCTYNADSSPAFVRTIRRLAKRSPKAVVLVAMKRRHASEDVFFDLMVEAEFQNTRLLTYPLPGDDRAGEETVEVYLYRYEGEKIAEVERSQDCECGRKRETKSGEHSLE